jgi:hypothetical protein
MAMIDGDAYGETPMHIKVVPHAVNVLVPRQFATRMISSGAEEAQRLETERSLKQSASQLDQSEESVKPAEEETNSSVPNS